MSRQTILSYLLVAGLVFASVSPPAFAQIAVEPSLGSTDSDEPDPREEQSDPSMMDDTSNFEMSPAPQIPSPSAMNEEPEIKEEEQPSEDENSFWSRFLP
ncbi:hypothetical protein GCM10007094_22620 [Pseudovibrio japonicus]|uniref:Secreted protein n=1 Tax=Pseudovibrio japonicus TaxID=366534 RepID=A0ABQ3EFN3_9HYPH|nr:hypothetical protein [Pseudovibrio japonicus]GHB33100.1 hypothetical protein GCM10007094_22620 [Pseudovibrio japonicus]